MKTTTINLIQTNDEYNLIRSQRYSAREFLQLFTPHDNIRNCGRHSFNKTVDFFRGVNKDGLFRSSIRNLISCRSVWACPYCSFNVSAVRSEQINQMLQGWSKLGYRTSFATFTVSHNIDTPLDNLWDKLLLSYKMFQQGSGYKAFKNDFKVVGSIRAVEATYGVNGWHLHIHTVFLHTGAFNLNNFTDRAYSRWNNVASINELKTSIQGFKIKRTFSDSGLATYLNKNSYKLSDEITKGQLKKYKASRTPFAILADMQKDNSFFCSCVDSYTGEIISKKKCDFCVWGEWEKTSRGKRQLGYSGKKDIVAILSQLDLNIELVEDNLIIFDNKYILSVSNESFRKMKNNNLVIPFLDLLQIDIDTAKLYLRDNNILCFTLTMKEEQFNATAN